MAFVGKKTSFRRDCDNERASTKNLSRAVGKKTSFRRDCDTACYFKN